ncbi:MAG: putative ABC transporter ATP-binding protein [Candidatus Heimdallarchaeota archaeon LC_3]|nr:MAG: putative ABC transporter ATP-binding protein [Candidatus Heimdallarchaeota archaeon LC_3]
MKVYCAGLINKPLKQINRNLQSKLVSDMKKSLNISGKLVNSQELNTFILVSGETNGKTQLNQEMVDKIEKGALINRFKDYYIKDESRLKSYMKNNQELKEVSQLVKDFIKQVDSSLPKKFDNSMKKINDDLPKIFCELSAKSFITLWDLDESQEYRFYLSGLDFPVFTGKLSELPVNIGRLVDKFIIVNFFVTFLKPTIEKLETMENVLIKLEEILSQKHYKTTNKKLQTKFELFLRILVAKLSALQELDNLIYRIINLFEIPRFTLSSYNMKGDFQDFNTTLNRITEEISIGQNKLQSVSEKIDHCQESLRDYLDPNVNGLIKLDNVNEFKNALKPVAELSVDLFVEAELLKNWGDYFGLDIPFFSFNTDLFETKSESEIEIDKDIIISMKGLYKNYDLGRTTVYALRGINLDIKEGEFIAIVGQSGAGKTTLLNCIASLDTPDSGSVYFRGKNLKKMSDSEKSKLRLSEMGFIFQSYALLPHYNARENVTLPADLAGTTRKLSKRINELLKGVGIERQAKQFPAQLSGGQMQRVSIARALTNQPAVIFADEPTGDLDSQTGRQVMELLKKFHEETGTTIVIITHDQEVSEFATRKIFMEDGVIIKQ